MPAILPDLTAWEEAEASIVNIAAHQPLASDNANIRQWAAHLIWAAVSALTTLYAALSNEHQIVRFLSDAR